MPSSRRVQFLFSLFRPLSRIDHCFSHLRSKHTVFGRLVGGQPVLDKLERQPIDTTDRPLKPVTLLDVEVFADPFEQYKVRLGKRLAREQNEREGAGEKQRRKEERDKDRTTCAIPPSRPPFLNH